MSPRFLLLDEPLAALDPQLKEQVLVELIDLHDKLKITSVAVTHDMKSAYRIADRIAMMYHGKIIAEGSPEEIQGTTNPVVHQFINGLSKGPITENEEE
jgi:phospholipid/cholesterol/gamma-HCH transport system ATP-binding protein